MALIDVMPELAESLSAVGTEVILFALAILLYSFFSGRHLPPKPSKKVARHDLQSGKPSPEVSPSARQRSPQVPKRAPTQKAVAPAPVDNKQKVLQQMRLIRNLGKDEKLDDAMKQFQVAKQELGDEVLIFNAALDAAVHNSNTSVATSILQEAMALGVADVVSFNLVIKGHVADGRSDMARDLLKEMGERGFQANLVTFHSLLNNAVLLGQRQEAWQIIHDLEAAGLQPNAVTCSILLKGMNGRQHGADVERVVELIDSSQTAFDEVLFTSMAEACIRSHRLDLLSAKIESYRERGLLQGLAAPTYGSMIKAFGLARDVDQIRMLWKEMNDKGVQPTPITLGCMVEALVSNRCTDEASDIVRGLQQIEEQKHLLNTVVYSTILKGYAASRRSDKMMSLYEEMRDLQIPCNTITYNTMLNAFAQNGTLAFVPKLLEDMKSASPPIDPDIVTYTTLVKCFCSAGDLKQAMALLEQMEQEGRVVADEVMYNSLLDGCAKQHRSEDAWKLLKRMSDAGIVPSNYTLSIMVKLLGRSKKLNQAFQLVKDLSEKHGFQANVQVYTCLMQACFHNRQAKRACELHDRLVEEGCVPDQKTYTVLVTGLLHAGLTDAAVQATRCAYHLKGHTLRQPQGLCAGITSSCLKEVCQALGPDQAEQLRASIPMRR
jgi:pentatricopeptide repeat protein